MTKRSTPKPIFDLRPSTLLATVNPLEKISTLSEFLKNEGLRLGYHPLGYADATLADCLSKRLPNFYHFKFGSIADRVASLSATFRDGKSYSGLDAPRAATGPDFTRLFIGSQNHFGKIKTVTLKLTADLANAQVVRFNCKSQDEGLRLVRRLIAIGIRPEFFEIIEVSNAYHVFVGIAGASALVAAERSLIEETGRSFKLSWRWLSGATTKFWQTQNLSAQNAKNKLDQYRALFAESKRSKKIAQLSDRNLFTRFLENADA